MRLWGALLKAYLDAIEASLQTLVREGTASLARALNGASAWVIGGEWATYLPNCAAAWDAGCAVTAWDGEEEAPASEVACSRNTVSRCSSTAGAEIAASSCCADLCTAAVNPVAVFHHGYKAQLRGRWTVLQEQYRSWGTAGGGGAQHPGGTLNAVLQRQFGGGGSGSRDGAAAPAAAVGRGAGQAPSSAQQVHPGTGGELRQRRRVLPPDGTAAAASGEIEPAPEQQPQQQHQDADQQEQQQQWWSEAAAAAQGAASAAVQQAASSVSQAVEDAAATAASWAASMRSVFVEPPAGWGVHEAIHRTGLLEDVSLTGQLIISRVFDGLRWLLGKLTLSGAGGGGRPQQQQRQGSTTTMGSTASTISSGSGILGRLASRLVLPSGGGGHTYSGGDHLVTPARAKLRSVTSLDLAVSRVCLQLL